MTFKELYQLQTLKSEIDEQRERKARLRTQAIALSGSPDGMPRAESALDKVGAIATEIAALETLINDELAEYWRTYVELEMYIKNIPDSFTRRIFRMRFIDGKTWNAIAYKYGGRQSGNSLRMFCKRFLETN